MFYRRLIEYVFSAWGAHHLLEKWRRWPWHNTFLLVLSIAAFAVVVKTQLAHQVFTHFHSLSYLGAFVAGMLSASIFTVVPAVALLAGFAHDLNPYGIALAGGAGAMIGDYIVFRVLKDKVFDEIRVLLAHHQPKWILTLFRTPYFAWLLPLMGMLLIASPGPDEVGLGLLRASHIKRWQFLLLTFVLNFVGLLLLVVGVRVG
jgi:hypothetical protein